MYEIDLISKVFFNSIETKIIIDLNGKVLFWNEAAENIFGYKKNEVLNKPILLFSKTSMFEFEYLIEKSKENKQTRFRTQKKSKSGQILDLIFFTTPIKNMKNNLIAVSITIQKTEFIKNISYIPLDKSNQQRDQKRTFNEIRKLILINLEGKKTINQIAIDSGINWRTVEKHLTYFIGKKIVEEVFNSEYVRIFELTEIGKNHLKKIRSNSLGEIMK